MNSSAACGIEKNDESVPAYYRAAFTLDKVADTFLNMESWGKGMVWVNGHAMGRFWEIGPQQTLFMPGCWLKKGVNEIIVLDLKGPKEEGLATPEQGCWDSFEIQNTVPSHVQPEEAVISCTWREVLGAFKDFNLTPGKKVIVVGSGPVGLSFVKLGKLFGLGQIDIVDMLPAKLEVARRMGADNGYTPAEISTPEFIAAANRSYDAVIDAVGLDVVVNSVLPLVKMGGDVCVYGVMTKNPTFDLSKAPYNFDLHMHQWPTRSEEKAAMTTLAQWIEEGRLSASDFITHRFAIEEIEEAFAAVKRDSGIL
jgi:L-iditol 2-dehydrogenase